MKTGKTVCDLHQLEILFLQNLRLLNHDWKANTRERHLIVGFIFATVEEKSHVKYKLNGNNFQIMKYIVAAYACFKL